MAKYSEEFGRLLEGIANEADAISLKYFRTADLQIEKKSDGSRVTQADKKVEAMARERVAASGLPLDVLGEEMGGSGANVPAGARARLIIDPIDGTEEFSRGIPTFGTLMGIEKDGEIVAAFVSAPGLHSRWWAYTRGGADGGCMRLHVSNTPTVRISMVLRSGTGPIKDS